MKSKDTGMLKAVYNFICCVFTISVLIYPCSSCKFIGTQIAIRNKTPKQKVLRLDGKEVRFIPISHFGQKEFYRKLKEKISANKASGYVVYYEQTIMKFDQLDISRIAYDTVRRKFRKMTGDHSYTRNDYQQQLGELGGMYSTLQVQPEYDSLGISSGDIDADVTIVQMTNEYERLYGKIILDSCDLNIPLASVYTCGSLHNSMMPIIRDFRSRNLAGMIKKSEKSKILVLYGKNHFRPVKRMLRHS